MLHPAEFSTYRGGERGRTRHCHVFVVSLAFRLQLYSASLTTEVLTSSLPTNSTCSFFNMASQISGENRILVIGLGVSVVAALGLMRYMLIAFRDAAEVEQPAPKTQYIDQKTEDALMPSTLEKLISSHNKDIQGVASRIVLDRALHDVDTIGGLLWEVTSKDPERREKALRVLHLICGESE